ncbi:MAG: HYR domain-containing protein [Chloroflexia bacterium]|nr:HYR domain-containing protein [Chloroflexia bacterium]
MKNKRINTVGCILSSFKSCFNTQLFSLVKKYSLFLFVLFLSFTSSAQVNTGDGENKITRKLLSITRQDPAEENTNADVLTFRATFEVDVQNVDAADFEIDGTTSASITNVVAVEGTSVYELTVSGGDLADFNGRVGLNLNPSHDIVHANRYSVSTEEPSIDESYLVDNTIISSVSVITTIASQITYNSALSGGEVNIEGDITVTNKGVCWSTNPNPTIYSNITSEGSGEGTFTSSMGSLTSGTTYYYRAYATASAGTVYGKEYSFTTPCLDPVAVTAITGNTEICPGGSTALTLQGGVLNNATEWRWYSESCGGTFVGSGASITVSPLSTSTYYVRAEGDCVNPSACVSITVNVREIGDPVVTCPTDVTVNNDLENCSAVINGISPLSVNNNCRDQTISYTILGATTGNGINDASGISFNSGISTVQYTANNGSGNTASCSFTVTVIDAEKPLISCPANVSISDVGENCSVAVSGIAPITVSDNCGGTMVSYSLFGATNGNGMNDASGNFFNVGATTVEYLVVDGSGNTNSCSFEVSVIGNDTQNPTITCPGDVSVNNDAGNCTAMVAGIAPVSMDDNCGIQTVTYTLSGATTGSGNFDASGNAFNLGVTTVRYTAVDGSGNSASCSFMVTVVDAENPTINCPADTVVVNKPGSCSAVVNGIAPVNFNDNCTSLSVTYTLSGATTGTGANDASGTSFNLGVTTVEYTVTDGSGNSVSCSFIVTVDDNEAPIVICPSNITISSENGACTAVVNNIAPKSVSDNCGTPTVTYTLSGETEGSGNNDASGTVFNVGETTVTYTATDGYGNASNSSFLVKVVESIKPVAITQDITIALDESGIAEITVDDINNNSTDNCGLDTMYLDKTSLDV